MKCAWCEQPSVTQILVEPAEYQTKRKVKTVKKFAVWAPVCAEHKRMAYDPLAGRKNAGAARRGATARRKQQMTIDDVVSDG